MMNRDLHCSLLASLSLSLSLYFPPLSLSLSISLLSLSLSLPSTLFLHDIRRGEGPSPITTPDHDVSICIRPKLVDLHVLSWGSGKMTVKYEAMAMNGCR